MVDYPKSRSLTRKRKKRRNVIMSNYLIFYVSQLYHGMVSNKKE